LGKFTKHYSGGWLGPGAGLEGRGNSCHHWDSIPEYSARSESQ